MIFKSTKSNNFKMKNSDSYKAIIKYLKIKKSILIFKLNSGLGYINNFLESILFYS